MQKRLISCKQCQMTEMTLMQSPPCIEAFDLTAAERPGIRRDLVCVDDPDVYKRTFATRPLVDEPHSVRELNVGHQPPPHLQIK